MRFLSSLIHSHIVNLYLYRQILRPNIAYPTAAQLCRKNHIERVVVEWELTLQFGFLVFVCECLFAVYVKCYL